MSAILWSFIGSLAGALGVLITLFIWVRERATLHRAEEITRKTTGSILAQDIDIGLVRRPQGEIDADQTTAIAEILGALQQTDDAVVQVGTILVVKSGGTVNVQNLSNRGLRYLEKHQELMRSSEAMLTALNDPNTPFTSTRVKPPHGTA
jgi:hypothetical protein